MRVLLLVLVAVLLIVVAGVVYLMVADVPAPTHRIEVTVPNDRLGR